MSNPPVSAVNQPLLEPAFMRKLEQWSLVVRRNHGGQFGGERKSKRHGSSVEFSDFRNYSPGDDLRFVDWNLYARLERYFLKLFLHEQELNVHILVDLSESMTFGNPAKSLVARKLAAALGFLALAHQDGLSVTVGSAHGRLQEKHLPTCRGRGFVNRMMQILKTAPEGGALEFSKFVDQTLIRVDRPGMVVLISDFLDKSGHEACLRQIVARRHEGIIIHLLDRDEWEPRFVGDLKLIDSEDGTPEEISITPAIMRRYRNRVRGWSEQIDSYCVHRGLTYLRVLGDDPPEDVVLKTLRGMGRLG